MERSFRLTYLVVSAALFTGVLSQQQFGGRNQFDSRGRQEGGAPCDASSPRPCFVSPLIEGETEVHVDGLGDIGGRSLMYLSGKVVNVFLGIPYARPPVGHLRFEPPADPAHCWNLDSCRWNATSYRPACPQDVSDLDRKFYDQRNISEDCLYLNVFTPYINTNGTNRTGSYDDIETGQETYPVIVFINGHGYTRGDSKLYPGHILADKGVVVVTFNYRLGALGFLSTLDENSAGNYGLLDTLKVLEFVREYIRFFNGDPEQVTIVGHDAGASIVGLLQVSPRSKINNISLFHRAIMMAGSDLCEWSVVKGIYNSNAREYAKRLGREVGCNDNLPLRNIVDCLKEKHFEDILEASAMIPKRYGSSSGPFGPVVDQNLRLNPVLPEDPKKLREAGNFMKVDLLAGFTKDEGAYLAENATEDIKGLDNELDPKDFHDIIYKMIREKSYIRNTDEVVDAITFEYTPWAKPNRKRAVQQKLIDPLCCESNLYVPDGNDRKFDKFCATDENLKNPCMFSDMTYGAGVDAALKSSARFNSRVYMYVFAYRPENETLPSWMGVPHGKDVEYFFGYPFFNETFYELAEHDDYTDRDREVSDTVQDMWLDFAKYGTPTPPSWDWVRNTTWHPYSLSHFAYLSIQQDSEMNINFRQQNFAFWQKYLPKMEKWWPYEYFP